MIHMQTEGHTVLEECGLPLSWAVGSGKEALKKGSIAEMRARGKVANQWHTRGSWNSNPGRGYNINEGLEVRDSVEELKKVLWDRVESQVLVFTESEVG